eukprot:CAMPEP_0197850590 /NCGR_PEP_ID=MMETSP1438-20131217/15783_1 /TAXON_ID=1461541 /ORGANISM="Pterosperma sp., Strain CCMP1384" /LENGTH=575 /DNA_ID=CAMNT_0043463823 /DNA_START=493 /DNA_END=2217 /DNA_ORIENTATION=-
MGAEDKDTSVVVANKAGAKHTRIKLTCPDRDELLEDILSYLNEIGADVLEADVNTDEAKKIVTDTFKVVSTETRQPLPIGRLRELQEELYYVLTEGARRVSNEPPEDAADEGVEASSPSKVGFNKLWGQSADNGPSISRRSSDTTSHFSRRSSDGANGFKSRRQSDGAGSSVAHEEDEELNLELSNEVNHRYTVLKLEGKERPGLLLSLMMALKMKGVSIAQAQIQTSGKKVAHVFYLLNRSTKQKIPTRTLGALLRHLTKRVTRRAFQDMTGKDQPMFSPIQDLQSANAIPTEEMDQLRKVLMAQNLAVPAALDKQSVVEELLLDVKLVRYVAGETILAAGQEMDGLFYIAEGEVERLMAVDAAPKPLFRMSTDEHVGPIFSHLKRSNPHDYWRSQSFRMSVASPTEHSSVWLPVSTLRIDSKLRSSSFSGQSPTKEVSLQQKNPMKGQDVARVSPEIRLQLEGMGGLPGRILGSSENLLASMQADSGAMIKEEPPPRASPIPNHETLRSQRAYNMSPRRDVYPSPSPAKPLKQPIPPELLRVPSPIAWRDPDNTRGRDPERRYSDGGSRHGEE